MILATADVTILGAGVFGLSIAFCAAQRGARVRVIDPNGVAQGASGGLVGALAPHTPDLWLPKKHPNVCAEGRRGWLANANSNLRKSMLLTTQLFSTSVTNRGPWK